MHAETVKTTIGGGVVAKYDDDALLSRRQVGDYLGISGDMVSYYATKFDLPTVERGVFRKGDVDEWLKNPANNKRIANYKPRGPNKKTNGEGTVVHRKYSKKAMNWRDFNGKTLTIKCDIVNDRLYVFGYDQGGKCHILAEGLSA